MSTLFQFLLAKEESPRVLSQSHSTVVTPPAVGKGMETVALTVEGTAWPPHRCDLVFDPLPKVAFRSVVLAQRLKHLASF